jgi:hypothetical protein
MDLEETEARNDCVGEGRSNLTDQKLLFYVLLLRFQVPHCP